MTMDNLKNSRQPTASPTDPTGKPAQSAGDAMREREPMPERENPLTVRWDTEHEEADVSRLLKPVKDDFAIYLDRNGWEIRIKPACGHVDYDDPKTGWEWLWPMNGKTTATPMWATDNWAEGPERKIAYQPYPEADDNEPPEPAR